MISLSLIKKWKNMLLHKSVLHVNQTEGLFYSREELKGYYNNLMDKVTYTTSLDEQGIPFNIASLGDQKKQIYFPIAIFQYGLGAWDLYLQTADRTYLEKALRMADWAADHQEESGAWDSFGMFDYSNPYSSMAQGEGTSLLTRAWKETGEERYLSCARKAAEFMLKPLEEGGTAVYSSGTGGTGGRSFRSTNGNGTEGPSPCSTLHSAGQLMLMEYPDKPCVLNGWIFSSFGLYDLWLVTGEERYLDSWKASVRGIARTIRSFDTGHWSYYDLGGKFNSPFYHALHIELLKAVVKLEPNEELEVWIQRWTRWRDHWFWKRYAFCVKAWQKLTEKKKNEWVLTG